MVIQKMSNWLSGFFLLLLMCQSQSVRAQTKHNPPMRAGLELAMKKLVRAIKTGDTNLFLSLVSKSSGVKQMNTISPRLESLGNLQYAELVNDFHQKREVYRQFFKPGDVNSESDDTTYFDMIKSVRQGRWVKVGHDTFVPALAVPFLGRHALYIKWQKIGNQWFLKEVGRPVS